MRAGREHHPLDEGLVATTQKYSSGLSSNSHLSRTFLTKDLVMLCKAIAVAVALVAVVVSVASLHEMGSPDVRFSRPTPGLEMLKLLLECRLP